jgi:peptidoglycan/LPS O-acetylase OafA/YrhL
MKDNNFSISDAASTHINIIRLYAIHIIAFSHGLENIAAIPFDNPYGVPGLNFLMLISGLLIAYSIITSMKDKSYDFKKYFLRRFSRIYPVFLAVFFIIILYDQICSYKFLEHIDTFLINILLLNDTILGYPYYGYNRHLWILPLFWWLYFILGWSILGLRTTKKKSLYIIGLAFFSFIIVLICLGSQSTKKINYLIIWLLGAGFMYLLNRLNAYFNKKVFENDEKAKEKTNKLKKRIKYFSLIISIVLFILALIRGFSFNFENSYELIYNLFLAGSILFFLLFSQYVSLTYPKKIKKFMNFFASYTFTLFLIHVAVYNLLLKPNDSLIYYIFIYLLVNIISIGIAYFTEFRYHNIYHYLLKIFNLDKEPEKNQQIIFDKKLEFIKK